MQTVNRLIARRAKKTVIGVPVADDSLLGILLDGALCTQTNPGSGVNDHFLNIGDLSCEQVASSGHQYSLPREDSVLLKIEFGTHQ